MNNSKFNKKKVIPLVFTFFFHLDGKHHSCSICTTKINCKHHAYTDSLKQVKSDNVFPIWGQKA